MAYEELSAEVRTVALGGIDKKTGKPNPKELEGYYIAKQQRPDRFNPNKPQNYYVFKTAQGNVGIYGKAGLNRAMKDAITGLMTKVVSTGELLDTGKGNPMKVFKSYQDKNNTIDVSSVTVTDEESSPIESYSSYEDPAALLEEEETLDEAPYTPPVAPKAPAPRTVSAENQAKIQALLNKKRTA